MAYWCSYQTDKLLEWPHFLSWEVVLQILFCMLLLRGFKQHGDKCQGRAKGMTEWLYDTWLWKSFLLSAQRFSVIHLQLGFTRRCSHFKDHPQEFPAWNVFAIIPTAHERTVTVRSRQLGTKNIWPPNRGISIYPDFMRELLSGIILNKNWVPQRWNTSLITMWRSFVRVKSSVGRC